MATTTGRTPISYGALDFITAIALIYLIAGIATFDFTLLVAAPLVWAAFIGFVTFFKLLPDGYFAHLFRRARPPKV